MGEEDEGTKRELNIFHLSLLTHCITHSLSLCIKHIHNSIYLYIYVGEEDEGSKRELNILHQMSHLNIVKIKKTFRVQNRLHIVFEYVEKNLLNVLEDSNKGLEPELIQIYIRQLCLSIAYCHEHRVIHRSLSLYYIYIFFFFFY